ncbi:hypothetical protein QR680_000048 [Steinernema hermaphroditum]|uniref:BZIP domain-containing protein n=1 Tax=Steinernema hermaphroditum TaxID=289476 RepID=A0AA39GVW7_9BILA|nr:hypothetical protein QR680_000048 [Steinernema hermaphroditum]
MCDPWPDAQIILKDDCLFSSGASSEPFGPDCYLVLEEVSSGVVADIECFDDTGYTSLRALKEEPMDEVSTTALMDDLHMSLIATKEPACSSSISEEISQPEYSSTLNFNNLMAPTPSSCSSPDSLCDSQYSTTDYGSYQTGIYQSPAFAKQQTVPAVKDIYGQFSNAADDETRALATRRLQAGRSRTSMHEMAVRKQLISEQCSTETGTLQLSEEEKRTLLHEGYPVPIFLPLNKSEEEALKVVRRKIKNKLSAQESRRRRKLYVDKLEQLHDKTLCELDGYRVRLQQLIAENQNLKEQVKHCQLHHHSGVY